MAFEHVVEVFAQHDARLREDDDVITNGCHVINGVGGHQNTRFIICEEFGDVM